MSDREILRQLVRAVEGWWRGIVRDGEENVSRQHKLHPHQKPVALLRFVIEYAEIQPRGLVVDPYAGSGSTLIAARSLGHWALGVELDERWCEVAARRIEAAASGSESASTA